MATHPAHSCCALASAIVAVLIAAGCTEEPGSAPGTRSEVGSNDDIPANQESRQQPPSDTVVRCAASGKGWRPLPTRTLAERLRQTSEPDLVVDRAGIATVVYSGRPSGKPGLYHFSADDPASPGDPQSLSAPHSGVGQDAAGIQTGLRYRAYGEAETYAIATATRSDHGAWTLPVELTRDAFDNEQIAVSAGGAAIVVWGQNARRHFAYQVMSAYRPAGSTEFGPPTRVPGADSRDFQSGIDAGGNAVLIYSESVRRGDRRVGVINAHRWTPDKGWGPAQRLSSHPSFGPRITVAESGTAAATWRTYDPDGGRQDYGDVTAWMRADGTWSSAQSRISPGLSTPLHGLDGDRAGRTLATWWRGADLMGQWSLPNGTWRSPFVVAGDQPNPEVPRLKVAVNGRGDALVVWRVGLGTDPRLRAKYRPTGGEWTPSFRVTPPGVRGRWYQVAVGECGHAAVAWSTRDHRVQVRRAVPTG